MLNNEKWLIITEKPSVAADIAKALGGFEKKSDFYESDKLLITWAVGHLLEFFAPEDIDPKYKSWLLQTLPIIPQNFEYKPKKGQKDRIESIKSLAKKNYVTGLINACDAGREGELIFRELYDYCKINKPMKRLWLQSMTVNAIKKEFTVLKDGNDFTSLGDAARCRAESDWLIGMNATRAMTRRLASRTKKGEVWSIGRVQTPTLALLVKREFDILKHRPNLYWMVEGRFIALDHEYSGQWFDPLVKKNNEHDDDIALNIEKDDRIFSKDILNNILIDINSHKDKVFATEIRKETKESAPQLFDLTSLQRAANAKYGISASRTLQAAQRLYEKYKLLTYPRTDSKYLPEDYENQCNEILKKYTNTANTYSKYTAKILKNGLLNKNKIFDNKQISDHFAIIPTGEISSSNLDGDDAKIFDLVFRRFLSAFMSYAVWDKVERITKISKQHFRTRVQDLREPGWREVYGLDIEEESKLPKLTNIDKENPIKLKDLIQNEALTKAPPRHSEAKLLSLMEHCGKSVEDSEIADALKDKGIGTPATRADIIENLISKEYIVRTGRSLKPSTKGIRLIDILSKIPVESLASVELTGELESDLKLVEKGKKTRKSFMNSMVDFTTNIINKTKDFNYDNLYNSLASLGKCPQCQNSEIKEMFWGYRCENEKNCNFIIWKEKNQRFIDRELVKDVLSGKIIGPLEFFNSALAPFLAFATVNNSGLVLLDENKKEIETLSSTGQILSEYNVEQTFLGFSAKIIETDNAYLCEFNVEEKNKEEIKPKKNTKKNNIELESTVKIKPKAKQLKSRMPKTLCGYNVSLNEFKTYIVTGQTEPILNFKSKKGRPFGASLHLKPNGNFEFRFVARKKAEEKVENKDNSENSLKKKTTRSKAKVTKIEKNNVL